MENRNEQKYFIKTLKSNPTRKVLSLLLGMSWWAQGTIWISEEHPHWGGFFFNRILECGLS